MAAQVQWVDVASEAGVRFQQAGWIHPPDDGLWPAFPEAIGGGACWFDADGDGLDDLYLPSQQFNLLNPAADGWAWWSQPHSRLYLNEGDGTFTDSSAEAGVATQAFAYGCSAADYDGDGCVDLFVSVFGASELFRNRCDGTFDNVTATAGSPLGDPAFCRSYPCQATSSAWADYDRDGDLDLYVGTYVNGDLEDHYRSPGGHVAQWNWLLQNQGDGTFGDVAVWAGVAGNATDRNGTKTLGVVWTDHDRDGWPDLFVANDLQPAHLFHNLRDGTFRDAAPEAGVADPRANMGVAAQDYDGDGWPDLFITHYEQEDPGFYHNRGDGTYEDRSGEDDLHNLFTHVGWGTAFVDWDRDGWPDLVVANGHTEWGVNDGEPLMFFHSAPEPGATVPWDRRWKDVTAASGPGTVERFHRGLAVADHDLDGDPDLALSNNNNESAQLLRASGVQNAWLNVRVLQDGMNRHAIGARVRVETPGHTQWRDVQAGSSYLSQHTLTQEFGLGAAREARVTVVWPDGGATSFDQVRANQTIRIDRASASYEVDVLSPRTRALVEGSAGQPGWWRTPARAVVAARDLGAPASGLAGTEFALDGGAWQAYEGQRFDFPVEGQHTLRMRSRDLAGNQEPVRTQRIGVDLTVPGVAARVEGRQGTDGWWRGPVRVVLEGSDALSGVASVAYRLDGGPWQAYDGAPVGIAAAGEHTLEHTALDRAGNQAPLGTLRILLDGEEPEVRFVAPDTPGAGPAMVLAAPGEVVVVEVAAEDTGSGVASVALWLDGRQVAHLEAPYRWSWRDPAPGHHALLAVAADRAGHAASAERGVVVLRAGAPAGLACDEAPLGDPWLAPRSFGCVAEGRAGNV